MPAPELRVWDGENMIYVNDSALWSLRIEGPSEWTLYQKTRLHCRVSQETDLMEYVGMRDADDEKVFDRDILRDDSGSLGLVWWNSEEGRYYLLHPDGEMAVLSQETIRGRLWRVVGNVHEDPHLMDTEVSFLLKHLKEHADEVKCPVCGGTDFESSEAVFSREQDAEEMSLAIKCVRCSHVMLFHLDDIA